MKKILFGVLIAFTAAFSSCNTHSGDDSGAAEAYGIYKLNYFVMVQHVVVTDPFNIALRLNALLVESGSYTDQTVKDKLFGNGTTIDYDQATGTYNINYSGSITNDLSRTGITTINTNGYANLQEANALWEIKTTSSSPYKVSFGGEIIVNIPDETYAYTISNNGTGWTVSMRNIQTYYSSDNSQKADWTGTYNITPDVFSGSSEVLNSKYSMDVNVASSNAMNSIDVVNVSTDEKPIRFNPLCGARALAPGGKMLVTLASGMLTSKSYFTTNWLESASGCKPSFTITYDGTTEEYAGIF